MWSDDGTEDLETTATDYFGFAYQAQALGVCETFGLASKLFEQDSIFLQQMFDDSLLLPINPARNHEKEDLELRIHGRHELAKSHGLKLALSSKATSSDLFGITGAVALTCAGTAACPQFRAQGEVAA